MTYNLAFTVAFAIPGCADKEGFTVTAGEMHEAIIKRANELYRNNEMLEAVGAPFDAFEETP